MRRAGPGRGSGELYPLSCTRSYAVLHRPRASGIGGGEGGGAADEFRAEMRITRFRYLAPFFNKQVGLAGKNTAGVFGQAERKRSSGNHRLVHF